MPLILALVIAAVVTRAIWGAEEYAREESKPLRSKLKEAIDRNTKRNPFDGDPSVGRFLWWLANATLWTGDKTVRHGWGLAKRMGQESKKGYQEAKDIADWWKNEREIAKAHKAAIELDRNGGPQPKESRRERRRRQWKDLGDRSRVVRGERQETTERVQPVPAPAPEAQPVPPVLPIAPAPRVSEEPPPPPERPTVEMPPVDPPAMEWVPSRRSLPPVPPVAPSPEPSGTWDSPVTYDVAVLDRPSVPELPGPEVATGAPTIVEAEIVPPVSPALSNGENMTALQVAGAGGAVANIEGGGMHAAIDALNRFQEIANTEQAAAEARALDALESAQRLNQAADDMATMIEYLARLRVDGDTLGDLMGIAEEIVHTLESTKKSANHDYLALQAANQATALASGAQDNMLARHGAIAIAAAEAPVEMADSEFYQPKGA